MSGEPSILPTVLALLFLVATVQAIRSDNPIAQDAAAFLSVRKRWWLGPILLMLVLLGLLVVFTFDSNVAKFIYVLF
jgi:hypothetical protein